MTFAFTFPAEFRIKRTFFEPFAQLGVGCHELAGGVRRGVVLGYRIGEGAQSFLDPVEPSV